MCVCSGIYERMAMGRVLWVSGLVCRCALRMVLELEGVPYLVWGD